MGKEREGENWLKTCNPRPHFMRKAVQECRGCDLYRNATQAVFGEIEEKPKAGQHGIAVMMIGEQPGDREDIEGRPFVGLTGSVPGGGWHRTQPGLCDECRKAFQVGAT